MHDTTQTLTKSTKKLGDKMPKVYRKALFHALLMRAKCRVELSSTKATIKENRLSACYYVVEQYFARSAY